MDEAEKALLDEKLLIGRNEWCQLPDLHIPAIKAKIDTGAKTSALHAFNIKRTKKNGKKYVSFDIHPIQGDETILKRCHAPILDTRYIMSSNGHKEHRYLIETSLKIGDQTWKIELTLSNRDPLRYRMLLGREALNNRAIVHPGLACHQGKLTQKLVHKIYSKKKVVKK